jgi:GNAT superfamily N-acetyltransferase
MEQVSIRPLQIVEIQEAAKVVASAMAPFAVAIFRDRETARRFMERGFKVAFAGFPDQVLVAKSSERVIGVMRMVEWPRCQFTPTPLQGLRMLPAMVTAGLPASLQWIKLMRIWAKHDPKEPHWHLGPLAVVPERQGQSIGSQLLKHFCNYVDKTGQAAYLETDRPENVRLYERFGWRVKEEATVLGAHNWFMWRPAQK